MIGGEKLNKKVGLAIGLLLVLSTIICFNINPVSAQQLTIDKIDWYTSGTDTILNITVTHITSSGVYNPLNFVDHLDIDIDGDIQQVNTADYQLLHFSVPYNMGEVTGTPTVKARACSLQINGEWSSPIVIPEFSLVHLLLILISISTAVVLLKSKITAKLKK
jgi:hypothetical protein